MSQENFKQFTDGSNDVYNELVRLGTLDKITLKGQLELNGKIVAEATLKQIIDAIGQFDGPLLNIHNQAKLGFRLPVGKGVQEVIIEGGCYFPSYEQISGATSVDTRYFVEETVRFVFDEELEQFVSASGREIDIQMMFGASVRITSTQEKSGLRFTTMISKSDVEKLKTMLKEGEYDAITFGTIIVPTDYIVGGRLTHEWLEGSNRKYKDIGLSAIGDKESLASPYVFDENWGITDGNYYCYHASIVNVLPENYDREFAAVGYVRYEKGDEVYYYYAQYDNSNSRSVAFVAKSAIEDRRDEQTDKYSNKIDEDNNYSPYSTRENKFLYETYLNPVWDGSLVKAQEISELSSKGGRKEINIQENAQKLKSAYIEVVYSTSVNVWGKFYYQNQSGTRMAEEDFYLQAGTSSHKQFLDIYRKNSVYWGNNESWKGLLTSEDTVNNLYLTKITFENAELKDCNGDFKLLGVYSYSTQEKEPINLDAQEVYVTNETSNMTVGAHLGLGGALTYLAKGGVYEGLTGSWSSRKVTLQTNDSGFYNNNYYGSESSLPGNKAVNLINNADAGRQIQQAWYAEVGTKGSDAEAHGYSRSYCKTNYSYWPYNPVQAGDVVSNPSQIIDYEVVEGKYIYVKTRAMDWAKGDTDYEGTTKGGVTTKSYMENYYRLNDDGTLVVNNTFIDWNGFEDMEQCDFSVTELPAVYPIQSLYTYVTNENGNGTWTDELERYSSLGKWGTSAGKEQYGHYKNIENWFAWANGTSDTSFGLGVYIPNVYSFVSGRQVTSTTYSDSGNKDSSKCTLFTKGLNSNMQGKLKDYQGAYVSNTSYTAPGVNFRMKAYKPIEYSYVIYVGAVGDIRSTFKTIYDNKTITNAGEDGKYQKVGLDAWERQDKEWTA